MAVPRADWWPRCPALMRAESTPRLAPVEKVSNIVQKMPPDGLLSLTGHLSSYLLMPDNRANWKLTQYHRAKFVDKSGGVLYD